MNSDRSFYFNPSPEGVVVVVVVVALVVGCLLGNSPSDQYGVFSWHHILHVRVKPSILDEWVTFGHSSQTSAWWEAIPVKAPPPGVARGTADLCGITGWWFGTWLVFFHILGLVFPTDIFIFQRGWNHQLDNIDVLHVRAPPKRLIGGSDCRQTSSTQSSTSKEGGSGNDGIVLNQRLTCGNLCLNLDACWVLTLAKIWFNVWTLWGVSLDAYFGWGCLYCGSKKTNYVKEQENVLQPFDMK